MEALNHRGVEYVRTATRPGTRLQQGRVAQALVHKSTTGGPRTHHLEGVRILAFIESEKDLGECPFIFDDVAIAIF